MPLKWDKRSFCSSTTSSDWDEGNFKITISQPTLSVHTIAIQTHFQYTLDWQENEAQIDAKQSTIMEVLKKTAPHVTAPLCNLKSFIEKHKEFRSLGQFAKSWAKIIRVWALYGIASTKSPVKSRKHSTLPRSYFNLPVVSALRISR